MQGRSPQLHRGKRDPYAMHDGRANRNRQVGQFPPGLAGLEVVVQPRRIARKGLIFRALANKPGLEWIETRLE